MQQPGRKRFWSGDSRADRDKRIAQVTDANDPGTSRDEVLRGAKRALKGSLLITGIIAMFSFYSFLCLNIPWQAAAAVAVGLGILIEWGKYWCSYRAIREPFFQGWDNIWSTPQDGIYFVGLSLVGIVCFFVSIYNSTLGAEKLSALLSYKKNEIVSVFTPNTSDIDQQIADARTSQKRNEGIKWKGTTTVTAQRAIRSDGKAIEVLTNQRDTRIAQQRKDWEKQQGIIEQQSGHTAGLVLKIGGFIELLQILLLFLCVSSERSLVDRQVAREQTAGQDNRQGAIGFRQNTMATSAGPTLPTADDSPARRYIGFNRTDDGNVRSTQAAALPPPFPVNSGPQTPAFLPDGAEQQPDGSYLFKQDKQLFKQVRNSIGTVIGLEYKGPKMQVATTLAYSQVLSRISSYRKNKWRNADTRARMIIQWEFARSLFEVPEDSADFKPIYTTTGEGARS